MIFDLSRITFFVFCAPIWGLCRLKGEVAEWLKAHAWKACKPQKGFEGSNPSLSARKGKTEN